MRLIPVLDLCGGLAVHARGGARARYAPVVSRLAPGARRGDAAAIAAAYAASGAGSIYVADLDAIEGREPQESLVAACCAAAGPATRVWIDAGIATPDAAARWLGVRGVERVIVGLETLSDMGALVDTARAVGPGRVVFSVDLRDGVPDARDDVLRRLSPVELARAGVRAGAASVLQLDLARVGSGAGVDEALAREIAMGVAPAELLVGGGIADLGAVHRLSALGVAGVLVASALHDGRIGADALAQHGPPA
ncbi:MAG TPA: HisA/HisF-related TIM barrel protein [Gemmatimonadaceae bacterium]|jgi:phosphoribosylformimino-5-aminoimidazole carboxamide ribotide isomerase